MLRILVCFFSVLIAGSAAADVAFHRNDRFVLLSKTDGKLVRTTCALDTLPLSIGTCRDEFSEISLALVYPIALPFFGGDIAQHAQRARLWAVEISRADEKIVELLSIDINPSPVITQLRQDISNLSSELTELDRVAYALDDQIALLESELARRPDNDILALLNTRRSEKKVIDDNRKEILSEMESLRSRMLQAQGGIFDQSTFQRVVQQRTEALEEYSSSLARVTAEENRRSGFERTLSYIGDSGFTYKLSSAVSNDRLSIEAAGTLFRAFDQAVAEQTEVKIVRTQPQLVTCPGGSNAFCGMRARGIVPVTSRLSEVSCRIVGAVSPCYRVTIFKAEENELIAVEGSIVTEEKGRVTWTPASIPAHAWDLEAKGVWVALGRCEYPGPGDISLRYPGRMECEFKLRGP